MEKIVKVVATDNDPYHEFGEEFSCGEKKAKDLVGRGWVTLKEETAPAPEEKPQADAPKPEEPKPSEETKVEAPAPEEKPQA